jgi:hypothetical protein
LREGKEDREGKMKMFLKMENILLGLDLILQKQ